MLLCALLPASCVAPDKGGGSSKSQNPARVQALSLSNLVSPQVTDDPVRLSAARNEWASFQLQVSGLSVANEKIAYTLRIQPLNLQSTNSSIGTENLAAFQILSLPVDVNRAGYVRHTGLSAATRLMPRALLPMPMNAGRVNLSAARDPANPTDPNSRAGNSPVMLWVDLHIPPLAPAGEYAGVCEVLQSGEDQPVASVPVRLKVYDFVLPDERHLNLVGEIDWSSLERLYPDRFEAVTPRFVNRTDPRYAVVIKTLDQLVKLAQAHRAQVVFPRLQPTVKWPGGRPPQVTWEEFDSVVTPWLTGTLFPDNIPLGYWPLPPCDGLFEYDPLSQRQYWSEAAAHFYQKDWLKNAPVTIHKATPGRASAMESIKLSADAAGVLAAHPNIEVAVPLEDDQVQFAGPNSIGLINQRDTTRLYTANPGIVFASAMQDWPSGVTRPKRWMRTDLTGLVPYTGAGGDERDVRLWAWLSFLPLPRPAMGVPYGPVQFIHWDAALPRDNSPNQPANPNELVWFYPGSWFGVDEPVPTVQLKWLRRAEQDYEYLYLARQRGDMVDALFMSRLIAKPVELQPNQTPDATFGLMCGTSDSHAWEQAIDLLAEHILMREPGAPVDQSKQQQLDIKTLNWGLPQERPVLLGRSAGWGWDTFNKLITLRLGIDIYNASDSRPDQNTLDWSNVPQQAGWRVKPQPVTIPALATYQVRRFTVDATVDPTRLQRIDRQPLQITFTNGFYSARVSQLHSVLPVAPSYRRLAMLKIDGSLEDWSIDDAIQDGPMLRMLSRPALQMQRLETASSPTQIFTSWVDDNFYLAFKVGGLSQSASRRSQNFVNYQLNRAWGEDLCQILIQPVYSDNSTGPVLHVVCKPNGTTWVERKMDPRMLADPWQPIEGAQLPYACTADDNGDWRGEIRIPWKAVDEPGKRLPVMLRFNFSQHVKDSGESASWAGPVDFGRDDAFTGVLVLQDPQVPGMIRTGQP